MSMIGLKLRQRAAAREGDAAERYRVIVWQNGGPGDIVELERLMAELGLSDADVDHDLAVVEGWRENDTAATDDRAKADARTAVEVATRKLAETVAGFAEELDAARGELQAANEAFYALRASYHPMHVHTAAGDRVGRAREHAETLAARAEAVRKPVEAELNAARVNVGNVDRQAAERMYSRHDLQTSNPRLFVKGWSPTKVSEQRADEPDVEPTVIGRTGNSAPVFDAGEAARCIGRHAAAGRSRASGRT